MLRLKSGATWKGAVMSNEISAEQHERNFIHDDFLSHATYSLDTLPELYLGELSQPFVDSLVVNINMDFGVGNVMPTVSYDMGSDMLSLNIEPMSIIEYSEKLLAGTEEDMDINVADLAKFFVGAGVARAILSRKAAALPTADQESRLRYTDKICDKTYLWKAVADFDDELRYPHDEKRFKLRTPVEKMGDDQVPTINVLRFVFGASLNFLSEVHDLQVNLPNLFRPELVEEEQSRAIDLNMNLAILDAESAFNIYHESPPYLLYGLSFPMTPAEELTSFFAEPIN